MSNKMSESFQEYAWRWRQTASQVQPALTKKENIIIFRGTLLPNLLWQVNWLCKWLFSNLVQTGERIEDGLKTEKIKEFQTLFKQTWNNIGGSTNKTFSNKKNEREKRRFVLFLAKLFNISLLIYHLLRSIKISALSLYFQHTAPISWLHHQRVIILGVIIRKVSCLKETGFLSHCLKCLQSFYLSF